jgi:hypothetical protein
MRRMRGEKCWPLRRRQQLRGRSGEWLGACFVSLRPCRACRLPGTRMDGRCADLMVEMVGRRRSPVCAKQVCKKPLQGWHPVRSRDPRMTPGGQSSGFRRALRVAGSVGLGAQWLAPVGCVVPVEFDWRGAEPPPRASLWRFAKTRNPVLARDRTTPDPHGERAGPVLCSRHAGYQ